MRHCPTLSSCIRGTVHAKPIEASTGTKSQTTFQNLKKEQTNDHPEAQHQSLDIIKHPPFRHIHTHRRYSILVNGRRRRRFT